VDLKKHSVMVVDRGLYLFLAQFLARYYGTVYYHNPTSHSYPKASTAQIGQGIDGVTWVEHIEDALDLADIVFFPDGMDGRQQVFLKEKGYKVSGSHGGEKMELDKVFFLDKLKESGLPIAKTHLCTGLDEVWDYVKDRDLCFMKQVDKFRSDFETTAHKNKYQTEIFLNSKRQIMGAKRACEVEILVQDPIESACEAGIDGFRLGGIVPQYIACGYEIKDKGIIERIMKTTPAILDKINKKLAPVYEELGYQGPYSNEVRITKDGKGYPIDETCRCPSPPNVLCEMYGKAYAEAIWSLAHGELPDLSGYEHEYGAEIILSSKWHIENEIYIPIPEGMEQWIKLKNCYKTENGYYCTPNDNDGIFGSVVAVGKSVEEVTKLVMERVKELDIFQMEYNENIFDKASEVIEAGRSFGIDL